MTLLQRTTEVATGAANFADEENRTDRMTSVDVISRHQVRHCRHWQCAFASQHKDHRYYEVVDETIHPEFNYLYFAIRNSRREIQAIQPFFIFDQDILAGAR